jgi:hypothetical protein
MKHNKTWYNNRIKEVQNELLTLQHQLSTPDPDRTCDDWSILSDREFDLQQTIKILERQRDTRHWTVADFISRDLVTSNID